MSWTRAVIHRKRVDNQMMSSIKTPGQREVPREPHRSQVTAIMSASDMCPAVLWVAQASWGNTVWEQLPSGACGTQAP